MDIGSDHWNDLRPQLTGSPAVKISSGMFPPITPSFARIDFSALNRSLPAIDQLIPGSRCGSDRPLDDFNTFRLGVEVGLIGSLCLFGFVGNALTIATLKHDSLRRKRTTNWLLQVGYDVSLAGQYLNAVMSWISVETSRELYVSDCARGRSESDSQLFQIIN